MKKGKGYAGPKSTFGTPRLLAKNFMCGEQGKVVFRSPYSLSKKLYVDKGKGYAGPKSAFESPHCLSKNFKCGEQGKVVFWNPTPSRQKLYVLEEEGIFYFL